MTRIVKRVMPKPALMGFRRIRDAIRKRCPLDRHATVLVYQMGKVGSTSVYRSLLACGVRAVHLHKLEPAHVRGIARKDETSIITLVREPISRRISTFFQNFEQYTGTDYNQTTLDVNALTEVFLSSKHLRRPPLWFDTEFKSKLGVDVYDYPFPQEEGWLVIETGKYRILILKLELDDAIKEEVISDFLNLSDLKLVRANVAQDKAYAETYQAFIQAIRLPEAYVEALCNARYTRNFYTDTEIEDIRTKWLRRD